MHFHSNPLFVPVTLIQHVLDSMTFQNANYLQNSFSTFLQNSPAIPTLLPHSCSCNCSIRFTKTILKSSRGARFTFHQTPIIVSHIKRWYNIIGPLHWTDEKLTTNT